uniref:Zinc-binding protein A33-like n=1 Tax=Gasterosteus aculeatus aculeatus TaxID=481459 RepID=A0AAQ4S6P4_GASAC|nr:zinc-binding protein A33-like [Gasterosteus aculeatus aculeatus]
MASRSGEDLSCSVCQDIFKDPVVLSCSHSFCRDCLKRWWAEKLTQDCPVCKRRSSRSDPPASLVIKNLCESFILERDQRGPEKVCSLHSEKLKLFCLDHLQPVCVVCRDSKTHNNHRFQPINEAAENLKEEIQKYLKPFKEKLKLFVKVKGNCDQTAAHMKVQARHTEVKIKDQFKKLHRFLEEEEEARLSALREEEKQKSQMMEEKMEPLSREIAALSDTVRATEEQLRAEDISFLNHYKAAVERVRQPPLLEDHQLLSGALIDQAKHLGNLTYNIWDKMKEMVSYCPVVLDPNTAHPELVLSEDLTSVSRGERQKLPDNPERFNSFIAVLGSEGFNSGIYSWDVEVGDNACWFVGVAEESVERKGSVWSGMWRIGFSMGSYKALYPSAQPINLSLREKLQRIRVHLDWEKGLFFFDADTKKPIFTFSHKFTQKLFPYISSSNKLPIKILPQLVSDDCWDSVPRPEGK